MRNYTHILNEGFDSYFKKLNESNELKEYEVEVRFGGFIGVEEIYTVSAYNEDEAHREALSEAAWDLNVENVENLGDDEYEVSITFGGYIGSEQYYTVDAEDDSEAEDAALDLASDDFEVLSVEELIGESKKVSSNSSNGSRLNEAVPRDLMDKIKNTRRYRGHDKYTDPVDYASANMQEITAADVMKMKKAGEDLSDIYVLNDDGHLIELDRNGHPNEYGSTYYERANQSLSKTLSNAEKIYKGNIDYFSRTQPDKYAERTSDKYRREMNRKLGKERLSKWDKNDIEEFRSRLSGPAKEIAAVKKEYEDGDISRKEMESRIAKLKDKYKDGDISYYAKEYSRIKDDRADARYYDSNKASRKNVDAYEKAKHNLKWAQYRLKDNEEKLSKAQAGEGSGNQRIIDLKRKIASLKRDLEYYEKELAENPAQKELDELQRYITKAAQDITNNQAVIDKLLRRNKNESLKRKSGKRLNIKNK